MQKDIDAQESIENLPNLAKKIAIKCTVSQACLFSLWTETIGLNITVSSLIIPWLAVITNSVMLIPIPLPPFRPAFGGGFLLYFSGFECECIAVQ